MGTTIRFTLFLAISYLAITFSNASEDVELKDSTLAAISVFAANTILKDAEMYGVQNTSSLQKIVDAHIVPGFQPSPTQYMLTLELENNCTKNDTTCIGGRYICEVNVLDAPWNEKRILDEYKTKCAERELNNPPEFVDSTTIARSLLLEDATTKALAEKAVVQMGEHRGGKHTLKHIGRARKVIIEETNSSLYYFTLYISTTEEDVINEACEITMEEALSTSEQILQSLRCFTTGDNEGADKFGITPVPAEELTTSLIRHAVLSSLAIIDAESLSAFQLKVIGYLLADSRVSVDSGTRDLVLKLGLVRTLCLKRFEEEYEDESKSCTIDQERDPSLCSITLTQWPWVSDGYLFSDFDCEPTTYEAIGEELEAYIDEDISSEDEAEVGEVTSNAVQLASRRENVGEGEEGKAGPEAREVEEAFVAPPCLGCPWNIDVNSAEVKELADFTLSALENAANSDKIQSIVRVDKATSQVVSGTLYMLTIELVDTNCLRSENNDRSMCQPDLTEGSRRMCTVGILDQPWLNSKQIREPECVSPNLTVVRRSVKDESDVKTDRILTPLSSEDEEAKDIAAFALNRLDSFDDNSKKRILVNVVEGTSNTEGRSKTFKMKIHIALADCPEGGSANSEACFASLSGNSQHYLCDIQVLVPLRDSRFVQRRLVNSRCFPIKPAHEINETAGIVPLQHAPQGNTVTDQHDPDDKTSPYVKSVADFITKTISQRSNGNMLNLVRIIRANTQLVAGKKVTLDVEVGFTNCTKANMTGNYCQLDNSQANVVCHAVVWDRAWLNDRRVTNVSCDSLSLSSANQEDTVSIASEMSSGPNSSSNSPSSIVGGHDQAESLTTKIEAYADFALAVIEEQSNAKAKLKVAKILASSVQIVQGKNIRLSLEVASTNCTKDQAKEDTCNVDENKDLQVCNIQIWDRIWLQEKQVTDLKCQPKRPKASGRKPKSEDFDESPFAGHTPAAFRLDGDLKLPKKGPRVGGRNSQQNLPLLGGYSSVDPAEASVIEIADFATTAASSFLNTDSANAAPYILVKIHSAKQKIIDGIHYKLELEFTRRNESLFCRVVVLEQSWLSLRDLTNMTCFPQGFPPRVTQRKAKNAVRLYRPAAVHDVAVKDAATFAVSAMSEASPNAPFSLMKIRNAARQIESKQVNYKLTLLLLKDKATLICNAIVTEKSSSQLVSSSCRDSKKRRGFTGGYSPADVNDATVREMADFATLAISKSTNAAALSVVNVISAETQIVSGKNYKMTLQARSDAGIQTCSVVVYDQSWTKTRKLTSFKCEDSTKSRVSRQLQIRPGRPGPARPPVQPNNSELSIQPPINCVGGYCPIDKNEKAVKDMANFATFALSRSMNAVPLQFVQVLSAERQVVAGFNYRLSLEYSEPRGKVFCKVIVFDQAWSSKRELSQMQCELAPSTVQPSPAQEAGNEAVTETSASKKMEVALDSIATIQPGAYVSIELSDDDVVELATFATTLLSHARNGDDLNLVKILSASKQAVAGSNYQLGLQLASVGGINLHCDVVVYNHASARQLTYSSCAPLNRRKRSSDQMPGGVTSMNVNSKKIKELSDFAVSAISLRSNEPNAPSNVRVLKATKQVVSGMLYTLQLELKFVDCQKEDESCIRHQKCNISIWEQPWLGKREVTKLTCNDVKTEKAPVLQSSLSRRQLLGGIKPADPSSKEIKAHAAFALMAIQAQSNARNLLKIVRVRKAGTQTVAGKKIYLTIEVGETTCDRSVSSNLNVGKCLFDPTADRQLCKVEIWTQPWLNERQLTNLKCAVLGATNKTCTTKTCKRSRRSPEDVPNTHSHHYHHHRSKSLKKTRRLKHMTAFRNYAKAFNKNYNTWKEFEHRYKIYRANQEKIHLLNRHEMGTAVYGDTPFSDWSAAEYKAHLAGFRPILRQPNVRLPQATVPKIDLPDEFDWRNHSVVTAVKNQGSCGSCWAFSVTGNVEGVYAVRNGELLSLSEQELVDCDKLDSGCNGGLPENAYKAINELGGLETESDYPYNGHQNKCNFQANITRVQITGGVEISTNETEMAQWLVHNGPISIGINANAMQYYRGGVSHPWKPLCRAGGIDHGVLIVGYGVSNYPKFNKTLPYWIVKNSWGTKWGEQGYYRVFRGDGTCGLNKMCTSATLD